MSVRRNLGFMSVAVGGSSLVQYLLYFCVARYLGASEYGIYSIALTVAVLTGPLTDLGMSVSLVRSASTAPSVLPRVLGASLLWRVVLLGPVALLAVVTSAWLGHDVAVFPLLVPLVLATFFDGVGTICSAAFQARERMQTSALILIGRNVLRAVALLVTVLSEGGVEALGWAFCTASCFAAVPGLVLLIRQVPFTFEFSRLWPTLRDALPFGLAIAATMLHGQVDIALLGHYADPDEVGRYHASGRFVILAQLVPQVVSVVTAPLAYRTSLAGVLASARIYRIKATAFATMGLLGTLALAVHGSDLVAFGLGSKFAGAEVLVAILAPVIFVKFLTSSLVDTLGAIGRQGTLGLGCCLALAVNVVGNLLWTPLHGALGACVATLVSETLLLGFLALATSRAGIELAWARVLAHPLLAVIAAAVVVHFGAPKWGWVAGAVTLAVLWLRYPTAEERVLGSVSWVGTARPRARAARGEA